MRPTRTWELRVRCLVLPVQQTVLERVEQMEIVGIVIQCWLGGAFECQEAMDRAASRLAGAMLNEEGTQGWEAVGLTTLSDGHCAVLMKRPETSAAQTSGARF